MDRLVAARKLVAELVKNEQLEVRRAEIVGRDLARYVETLGRPPSGGELEDWLDEHAQVSELYAGPILLEELVYRYLTPPPADPAVAPDAHHPELERQLREAPEGAEPYLVYADWLQERSDPLGELIALGVAAAGGAPEAVTRFERHLKLHEARFLGGLAGQLGSRAVLRWRHGLVQAIEAHAMDQREELSPAQWGELLGLRVCGFVEALTLRRPCSAELDAVIAEHAAPSLRTLTLEGAFPTLPEQLLRRELRSLAVLGGRVAFDPAALPATLERLELRPYELTLEGDAPPRLAVRELVVWLNPSLAAALAGARLPRTERLTVALETSAALAPADAPGPALLRLLGSLELPALTHLAIANGPVDPRTFGELARLPLASRLTSLALTNADLTDETIRSMVHARAALTALAELDVSSNELSRDGLAAARELAPSVISRRQHRRGNAMERRVRQWAGSRLQAAEGIADPDVWRAARIDGDLRWARYRGGDQYELYVSTDLQRYGCSCPSSIQPCKHVVALALVAERTTLAAGPAGDIEDRVARERGERYDEIGE
jgi:uncharacterized protein (TIGR02996 family)